MDWKLALIVLPVTDVDRAKSFYINQAGFGLDVDHSAGEDFRVVQLTPPGSACSIALMRNLERAGSAHGLHLVVSDIEAARAELLGRGLDTGDYYHFGASGQAAGLEPGRSDYSTFLNFSDPDGNSWVIQEVGHSKAGS